MRFPSALTLRELAAFLDASFTGDGDMPVTGINEIHVVEPGDVVFVDHPKYYEPTLNSAASVVLIDKEVEVPEGKGIIVCEDPFSAFNKITRHYRPFEALGASVSATATIGDRTVIQPNAVVGNHVTIGADCIIHSGVIIYDHAVIGNGVVIHANTVIGGDAFYYKNRPTGHDKMHTCGTVQIEDDVEIGVSCTIDRGVTGTTVIGRGTKMDNQVHIGHDTKVGAHCLFAAQVGISGCVVIEDRVSFWGQSGCTANVRIGSGATIYAQSGIMTDIPSGQKYFGSPAGPAREKYRELFTLERLAKGGKSD